MSLKSADMGSLLFPRRRESSFAVLLGANQNWVSAFAGTTDTLFNELLALARYSCAHQAFGE